MGDTSGKLSVYKGRDDSKPWAVRPCQGMVSSPAGAALREAVAVHQSVFKKDECWSDQENTI